MKWSASSVTFTVLCLTALSLAQVPPIQARQYAFLVACSDYSADFAKVPFTVAEMQQFRSVLIDSGIPADNIAFLHDGKGGNFRNVPYRTTILDKYRQLLNDLGENDSIIVVLTGHGVMYRGDKTGYFCPLDARVGLQNKHRLIPMVDKDDGLLTLLQNSKAKRKLLIVNACRNDPVSENSLATNRAELVDEYPEEVTKGTVTLFACGKGQKSLFYTKNHPRTERHDQSLFMYHLTEAWKGTYSGGKQVSLSHMLDEVCYRVATDARKDFEANQMPFAKSEFEGNWLLSPGLLKELTNSIGMKLVRIPAGKFLMGSPASEKNRQEDEGPQHEVEITKSFYLGAYEVTQAEYAKVMGENPSEFNGTKDNKAKGMNTQAFPVERVSWEDATEFCRKLSALPTEKAAGRVYSLPTEAQWEYACRSGSGTYQVFHYGNSLSSQEANFYGEYPYGGAAKGPYLQRPTKVGSYHPNQFGLYDMHGNVWEWCQDWYDEKLYGKSDKKDPQSVLKGSFRVIRGGGWFDHARGCQSAARFRLTPSGWNSNLGFRVAVSSVGASR